MVILYTPENQSVISLQTDFQQNFVEINRNRKPSQQNIDWQNLTREDKQDDSLSKRVRFTFSPVEKEIFRLGENAELSDAWREVVSGTECFAENLKINTTYYWSIGDSEVFSFRTADIAPRWITVDGVTNVRDIGGWKTLDGKHMKQGLIYRGSEFNSHVEVTPKGIYSLVCRLGLKTDLDIRGEAVGKLFSSPLGDAVQFLLIPCRPYDEIFREEEKKVYGELAKILVDENNYPLYFHCWGGADRTGTLAFMLQSIAGVSDEDMMLDFELTSLSIWGDRSRKMGEFRRFFAGLDAYGTPEESYGTKAVRYMEECAGKEIVARLRHNLVEE